MRDRFCFRFTTIVLMLLLFLPGTYAEEMPRVVSQESIFLRTEGGKFYLGKEEFRAISFNKFDLFDQYFDASWTHRGDDGRAAAKKSLRELKDLGFDFIRVSSLYYPAWIEESFFDNDRATQDRKRKKFFEAFDEMLGDCREANIKICFSLMWYLMNLGDLGHHSLREGLVNPDSLGYRKFKEYVETVVLRYKDSPSIMFWETGNEYDLAADGHLESRFLHGNTHGDELHPGPVVRDSRNNFSSEDLGIFFKRAIALIKSLDSNHLVSTGNAHLLLSKQNIKLLEQYADVVSVHYYRSDPTRLRRYKDIARSMRKPLFVGEIGSTNGSREQDYTSPEARRYVVSTLGAALDYEIPIVAFWAYADDRTWAKNIPLFNFRVGRTDDVLDAVASANYRAKKKK